MEVCARAPKCCSQSTFQGAKSEQEGAAGIPPSQGALVFPLLFPLLSCCYCCLQDKASLHPAWTIFFL